MSNYYPDKWCILRIETPEEVFYKVFGCWKGGFAGADSWKLNSGIVSVKDEGDCWQFESYSGSSYFCAKGAYGYTFYGQTVLDELISTARSKITIMPEDWNWSTL